MKPRSRDSGDLSAYRGGTTFASSEVMEPAPLPSPVATGSEARHRWVRHLVVFFAVFDLVGISFLMAWQVLAPESPRELRAEIPSVEVLPSRAARSSDLGRESAHE